MEAQKNYSPPTRWSERAGQQDNEPLREETIFFTVVRQQGATADYIDFHLKPGRHHTLSINDIREMCFDPEQGIFLFFGFGTVHIEGRNLGKLHALLCQRKVSEIREFSEKADVFFEKDVLVIQRIHYESEYAKQIGL